jgi:predicted component of type VI protein secretion system
VTTATQTRPKTRKTILATVARFAHVSVRDVEAAVKDPGSVTSDVLAVVREAAQEVGFDMAAARPRRKTARPPEDGLPRTRSGLRKLDPKPLVEQGRRQAGELAELLAAAARSIRSTPGNDSEFYRSAAAKEAWMAVLERASRMVESADEELEQLRPSGTPRCCRCSSRR